MPDTEIELNPIDFLAVGTVGPKGRRTFHIQAGKGGQVVTLTLEKEQTQALGEAIAELLDDLLNRYPEGAEDDDSLPEDRFTLRDPVDPMFRVAQIGLGYDETRNMVVIVAQELLILDEDEDPEAAQPRIVRFWGTRDQFRAMSKYASQLVKKGRADPKGNGRVIYYWT
jgi:uncharacterized repeat protein (TIGR03847 family)